jgi:putative Mg2+ transporter-C (MgtC) family protein
MGPIEPTENAWWSLLLRLGIALVSGALIGWERHSCGRPAGLRTHMLVSIGAAMFVLSALQDSAESASRVVQGITAGIGFVGAGEILHKSGETNPKEKVKGLTSAAAIWVTAALGVSAGHGLWRLALVGSVLTLLTLTVAKRLETHIRKSPDEP